MARTQDFLEAAGSFSRLEGRLLLHKLRAQARRGATPSFERLNKQ
jgi:hypothetical protein